MNKMFKFYLPFVLLLASSLGLLASFVLTYEEFRLLDDPSALPACDISPIVSCKSVMDSAQGSLLGVPNSIYGLVAFTGLLTISVLLAAKIKLNRLVWLAMQLAATAGVLFMHYLFVQGVFVLNTICPWCFVVWISTIPIFLYITLYNVDAGYIRTPDKLKNFFVANHLTILVLWYAVLLLIILQRFWYYWETLV